MTEKYSAIKNLECSSCNRVYPVNQIRNTCNCGQPLVVRYDLEEVKQLTSPQNIRSRAPNMWRYHELLPVSQSKHVVSLGEGFSPLLPLKNLGLECGLSNLFIKYEGSNVGGTFKARGASCGLSKAKELGAKKVAIATNGNAGEAWAMYASRGSIPITVIMPKDAQKMPQIICNSMGASTYLINGMISDAGKFIEKNKLEEEWFDVSTLKEPYRLEGKKTITFEIIEQLGWTFPDAVLFPTGGGIAIAAAYKAFLELQQLGWVKGKLPRLIAVQAQGCAPLEHAFLAKSPTTDFFHGAHTKASGLRVPKPFCDFMVLEAIYKTQGLALSVSDEEMLEGVRRIGHKEGLFLCPEAGACIAALQTLKERQLIEPHEKIVILGSGSGLKYQDVFVQNELTVLDVSE
ncbi:MAG: Threonine synthase [Chlamydiae bacterium]|nr:Threonine synthase [Chlamydiota bacterium]